MSGLIYKFVKQGLIVSISVHDHPAFKQEVFGVFYSQIF